MSIGSHIGYMYPTYINILCMSITNICTSSNIVDMGKTRNIKHLYSYNIFLCHMVHVSHVPCYIAHCINIFTSTHTYTPSICFFSCGWNFIQFRVVAALNSAFLVRTACAPCFHEWGNHWAYVCFSGDIHHTFGTHRRLHMEGSTEGIHRIPFHWESTQHGRLIGGSLQNSCFSTNRESLSYHY